MNIETLVKKVEALEKRTIREPAKREFITGFGENFHSIIRDMICREIDAIHDSEWFRELWGIPTKWYERIEKLEEKVEDLKQRLIDLEEFTGAYNDNEFEDARTGEQIKADIKKRRQNEKS